MRRKLITLVVLSPYVLAALFAGSVILTLPSEEPPAFAAVRSALAEGDSDAARSLLAPFHSDRPSPALLALVELAEMVEDAGSDEPLDVDRVLRYLRRNPGRDEALTALVLGLKSAAEEVDLHCSYDTAEEYPIEEPPIDDGRPWEPELTDSLNPEEELVTEWIGGQPKEPLTQGRRLDLRIIRLASHVKVWRARRPDDPRLLHAHAWLERARLSGEEAYERLLRLPSGTALPIPAPLAQPLRVRLFPLEHGTRWRPDDPRRSLLIPRHEYVIPVSEPPASIPAPAPGGWLLEVRDADHEWRRLRQLQVTDLELTAQSFPGGLVVLACLRRKPAAGVTVTVHGAGEESISATTDAEGFVVIDLPPPDDRAEPTPIALRASCTTEAGHTHRAEIRAQVHPADPVDPGPSRTAHLFVERPLYLPGETIRGRLLVRRHRTEPLVGVFGPTAFQAASGPVSGQEVTLICDLPNEPPRRIPLTLDAWGVAEFAIPTRRLEGAGAVTFDIDPAQGTKLTSHAVAVELCHFRRPPLLVDVTWPDVTQRRDVRDAMVTVRGRYPAGTAAGGLLGGLTVAIVGDGNRLLERSVPFRLDGRGTARIRLGLENLDRLADARGLYLCVQTIAPDGQNIYRRRSLDFSAEAAPAPEKERVPGLTIHGPAAGVVTGRPVTYTVTGPPGAPVLFTVARETALATRVVTLDDRGRAEVRLEPAAAWWPNVHLVADTLRPTRHTTDSDSARLEVKLRDPAERIDVRLEASARSYRPGETVTWTVATADEAGRPVPATVAVAVVDETLFSVVEDRNDPIAGALRPAWLPLVADSARSPRYGYPIQALGMLLRAGRIEPPSVRWHFLGSGAGGAFAGRYGGCRRRYGGAGGRWLNSELRPTAVFRGHVVTDASGRAEVRFTFPGDIGRWRVTLVAADRARGTGTSVTHVRTELPVSAEILVPRLFRRGDRLRIPVRVHQTAGAPEEVTCRVVAGEALGTKPAPQDVSLRTRAGEAIGTSLDVIARRVDESVALSATVIDRRGRPLDHVEHRLPVRAATDRRTSAATATIKGEATLRIPPASGGGPPDTLELEISGSIEGVLRRAAEYLTEYPHGCAEQTCSRLVPVLMAHHAARGLDRRADLPSALADRLHVGLERLRTMQESSTGGFVWWPGRLSRSNVDLRMSAVVFRFFALMEEAGLSPRDHGLRTEPDLRIFSRAIARLKADRVHPASAELVIACLRLNPRGKRGLEAARSLAAAVYKLPLGTAARLGTALARAGDAERARTILGRLESRLADIVSGRRTSVHESPAARAAALLQLALDVDDRSSLVSRLVDELLARFEGGRVDHTAGTAAAVAALSHLMRLGRTAASGSCTLTVQARDPDGRPAGAERVFEVPPGRTRRVTLSGLPQHGSLHVRASRGRRVWVTFRSVRNLDAATAPAEAGPLIVKRRLFRLVPDDSNGTDHTGYRREPVIGPVRRNAPLEVELVVTCSPRSRYLLLECPIPAGFECVRAGPWERYTPVVYDDRVEIATEKTADGVFRATFRMVPGREGTVVWPAARAEAMYAPENRGWSRGAQLTVVESKSDASADPVVFEKRWLDWVVAERAKAFVAGAGTKRIVGTLAELGGLPYQGAEAWLFAHAPEALGNRLRRPEVLESYLRVLGARAWDRLSGDRLGELLSRLANDRSRALRLLARGVAEAGLGPTAVARLYRERPLPPEERRLCALAAIHHGRLDPDRWRHLERLTRLVSAADFRESADRTRIVEERFTGVAAAPGRVRAAFLRACVDLWQVQGIGSGARETPEKVEALCTLLGLAAAARPGDADARKQWRRVFEPAGKFTEWAGYGSAPPPGYRRVRECYRRLTSDQGVKPGPDRQR